MIYRGYFQGGATDPYGGCYWDDPHADDHSINRHEPTKPNPALKLWRPCRVGLLCSLPNLHLGSCDTNEKLELVDVRVK